MKEKRIAVYSGNRAVYPDMETAAKSILYHGMADLIYFLIEDEVFPKELPGMIRIVDISGQQYFRETSPNWNTQFTYCAAIRAAYADIFPQYDRILSLDVDTIVMGDISGLWNTYIDDVYFAAATEHKTWPTVNRASYYNMGVTLFNLKKLRDDNMWQMAMDDLNVVPRNFLDQDALVDLCAPYTREIPILYNYNPQCLNTRELPPEDIRIRHYAGEKFVTYRKQPIYQRYAKLTWEEVMDSFAKHREKNR